MCSCAGLSWTTPHIGGVGVNVIFSFMASQVDEDVVEARFTKGETAQRDGSGIDTTQRVCRHRGAIVDRHLEDRSVEVARCAAEIGDDRLRSKRVIRRREA